MKWPRSRFLGIMAPAPGPMTDAAMAALESAFGEAAAAEEIGLDLRIALPLAEELSAGQRASIDSRARMVAGAADRRVSGVVVASDGTSALASLTAILPASVSAGGSPVSPGSAVVPVGEDDLAETAQFTEQQASGAPLVVDDGARTALNSSGFTISSSTVFFDGTSPLFTGRSLGADLDAVDSSLLGSGTLTRAWSNTDLRSIVGLVPAVNGQSVTAYFPLHIPLDFECFSRGQAPAISVAYRSTGSGTVVPTVGGHALAGAAVSAGAWASRGITAAQLAAVTATPGSTLWLAVAISGHAGDQVAIESTVVLRYQPKGNYQ